MEKPCKHQRVNSHIEFEDSAALRYQIKRFSTYLLGYYRMIPHPPVREGFQAATFYFLKRY